MEHELRLATYQQRAGGQDDGSLNKLPQIRKQVLLAPFAACAGHFFHGPQNAQNEQILQISLGRPMGPINPV